MRSNSARSLIALLSLGLATMACTLASAPSTATPNPTPLPILLPSATVSIPTAAPAPTNTNLPATPKCTPSTAGVAYRIQAGDSLSLLAARTKTTVDQLVASNCLANANVISVGQLIYLPRTPATNAPATTNAFVLQVIPSEGNDPYNRYVQPNATVTLLMPISGLTNVTFLANEMGRPATTLGISANPVGSATLVWQIPNSPGLVLYLSANGQASNGQLVSTQGLVRLTVLGTDSPCVPSPRLTAGQLARVTPGLPNMLRTAPGTNNPSVNQIPAGTELLVLSGPYCAGGLYWWQVNCPACAGQQSGYVAEGQGTTYWLEPESGPSNTN